MASLRDCVGIVNSLDEYDVDDVVAGMDDYRSRGMNDREAAIAATRDLLADAEGARSEFAAAAAEQFAEAPPQPAPTDPRLNAPEVRGEVESMARNAGWAEENGKILRDEEGNVTARTKWIPNEEWFSGRPRRSTRDGRREGAYETSTAEVKEAARKALAGEPLAPKEQRVVDYMIDTAEQAVGSGKADDGDFLGLVEELRAEQLSEEQVTAGALKDAGLADNERNRDDADLYARAYAINPEKAEAIGEKFGLGSREADAALTGIINRSKRETAEPVGSDRPGGEGDRDASPDRETPKPGEEEPVLSSYSAEDLRARDAETKAEEKRRIDKEAAAEAKAAADAERDDFDLTGSDRAADANPGQGTLYSNPFFDPAVYKPMAEAIRNAFGKTVDFVSFRDAISATPFEKGGVPSEKLRDTLIRRFADKHHFVGLVQKQIEASGKKLDDLTDTMLATDVFAGRAGRRLLDVERKFVQPLMDTIRQVGKNRDVSLDDIGNYLMAKHAEERNRSIAQINPGKLDGSGLSNAEAKKILAEFQTAGKTASLERVAKLVYALGNEKKRIVRESNLLPKKMIDSWDKWKFYVPLKGAELEDGMLGGSARSSGFTVKGLGEKQATGRFSQAANLIENMIIDTQLAQIRAEKARVGRAFLRMVKDNPNSKLWQVDKLPTRAVVGDNGMVRYQADGLAAMDRERVVVVTDDQGVAHTVTLNGDAGLLVARSINNLGVENSNVIVRNIAKFSRLFAALQTKYNPQFTVTNLMRDVQTAMINAGAQYDAKMAKDIAGDIPKAAAALWRDNRNKAGNGEWDGWVQRFAKAGGETHFLGTGDIEQRKASIERAYKEGQGHLFSLGRKGVEEGLKFIGDANSAGENALRLSTFRRAVERGMSEDRAAQLAKNVTTNFNKSGELGPALNSLYVFYNAGIQGTRTLLRTMKTPKGASIILAGGGALGMALSEVNRNSSDTDEDGVSFYDKIPPEVKNKWMFVMSPVDVDLPGIKLRKGRDYIKLAPIPFGYGIGYNIGGATHDMLTAEDRNASKWEGAVRVAGAFADSFNPFGQTALLPAMMSGDGTAALTEAAKLASPTITDPVIEMVSNRDWTGNPVYKEQPSFGSKSPDSETSFAQTSQTAKEFAKWMNDTTGGDAYSPGGIDVSPDVLDYLTRTYSGGAGRFVFNAGQTMLNLATGKEVDAKRVPFVQLATGETRAAPYKEYRRIANEIDADRERFINTDQSKGEMYLLYGQKKNTESFVRRMMEAKRAAQADGDKATVKEIEGEIETAMKEMNRAYYEAGGQQRAGF